MPRSSRKIQASAATVPTVRKQLRRFQQHGPSGLVEYSRARDRQPHKTAPARIYQDFPFAARIQMPVEKDGASVVRYRVRRRW